MHPYLDSYTLLILGCILVLSMQFVLIIHTAEVSAAASPRTTLSESRAGMPHYELGQARAIRGAAPVTADGKQRAGKRRAGIAPVTSDGGDDDQEKWCRRMQETNLVVPGSSWGSLGEEEKEEWKLRGCDQYYSLGGGWADNRVEADGFSKRGSSDEMDVLER